MDKIHVKKKGRKSLLRKKKQDVRCKIQDWLLPSTIIKHGIYLST
jgi:hypothetical protein